MIRANPLFFLAIATIALVSSLATAAVACGYHDPRSMRQGVLNFMYPEALHVIGATRALQQDGRLPMPDIRRISANGRERAKLDAADYWRSAVALSALGLAMEPLQTTHHRISLVLVRPMLWTNFLGDGPKSEMSVSLHAPGPTDETLVLVTDELPLNAIADGQMRVSEAMELGIIRAYGTQEQIDSFLADFGNIGTAALPKPDSQTLVQLYLRKNGGLSSPKVIGPNVPPSEESSEREILQTF